MVGAFSSPELALKAFRTVTGRHVPSYRDILPNVLELTLDELFEEPSEIN
jgi:hypothetical protein